ncbi:MAG TPA: MerR family transcriptional regulator [Blastocatellia bacterium]|nr:MerR family transcriptional regulator [Blastocatellia bacterium]
MDSKNDASLSKESAKQPIIIPEKLFFKIGEVAELLGEEQHVLRYWESEFPMLAPQKNRAGQRTYRRKDVEMALHIKELLRNEGFTIEGARKKLQMEGRGGGKLKVVTPEMASQIEEELQQQRAQIAQPLSVDQRKAVRRIRKDLESILSMLNSEVPK